MIKINTGGYAGRLLRKKIEVTTNDPKSRRIHLTVAGRVEHFAFVKPLRAVLRGTTDDSVQTQITVVPQRKYPFKILKTGAEDGRNINFQLEEVERDGGKIYVVTVVNLFKKPGTYFDTIFLRTDSRIMPNIRIPVYGNIRKAR